MLVFRTSTGPVPRAVANRWPTVSSLIDVAAGMKAGAGGAGGAGGVAIDRGALGAIDIDAGTTGAGGAGIGRGDIGTVGIDAGTGSGAGTDFAIGAGIGFDGITATALYGDAGSVFMTVICLAGVAAVGWYADTPGAAGSAG